MSFELEEIRGIVFIGSFLVFAGIEAILPDRQRVFRRSERWGGIGLLMLSGVLISKAVMPVLLYDVAGWSAAQGFGVLNNIPPLGAVLVGCIGFLALDFGIWLQHYLYHKVPFLWPLHRVHHTDVDIDVATAVRFHPIEILLSLLFKSLLVILIGVPPLAAALFEIALSTCALFNHSNFKLPSRLERLARSVIVTPSMHRIHHSVRQEESDTNFATIFSFWDRLFGSYTLQFSSAHPIEIGQIGWRGKSQQRILPLLIQPARSPDTDQD
jgi:sterol desaturase/sphingolipid hydroxylase (fatty acid hydroxylase superfamily)